MSVFIIGAGMGDTKTLTCEAKEKIENSDIIIGSKRIAKQFERRGKKVFFEYAPDKIVNILQENTYENAAVLFTGDASFFSGAKKLRELLPAAEVIAGISCVSYFCAKIGMSYDDMNIISAHGRECSIVSEVRGYKKTFLLLGENPCGKLSRYGMGGVYVYIGENLSYENERILSGRAEEFTDFKTVSPSVMIIVNDGFDTRTRIGISDGEFITGSSPITKREVRAVSVSSLDISPTDICFDVGAGTGSVSVEMALLCPRGKVYAIEKNPQAAALTEKNAIKFQTDNIEIIQGMAPDALSGLPSPDKVFIGGSSGRIFDIIKACDCRRVTVNAITLETLEKAIRAFSELGYNYEVTQISVSRGKKVSGCNMMTAQNPIFVISGERK